ncbi:MAG: hypothetical protein AMJ66_11900 [Betaproteobacteria bacterium SG8_40]|nr:MAG: hypothetical protein AMJ66_11900 [Betaproteobacteria bacterium SG8_40]
MKTQQRGATLIGMALVAAGVVFFAIMALKLVPAYIEQSPRSTDGIWILRATVTMSFFPPSTPPASSWSEISALV